MFGKFRKFKKAEKGVIQAVATLDLRNHSAQSLSEIKGIRAVALIILPEDGDESFYNAYNAIPKAAVAMEIKAKKDENITTFNGINIINKEVLIKDSICMINGIGVIMDTEDIEVKIIANGILVVQKGSKASILTANGIKTILEFENAAVYEKIEINSDFLNALKDKTLICGEEITLDGTVTKEQILKKGIVFAAQIINCPAEIYGTVAAVSTAQTINQK